MENSDTMVPTPLGKACFASCVQPEEAEPMFWELFKAWLCLSLSSDLHLCYLITMNMQLFYPNWKKYQIRLNSIGPENEHLIEMLEINIDYILMWE